MLVTLLGLFVLIAPRALRVNVTPSVPLGLYRIIRSPVNRGALVEICPPPGVALMARQRAYLGRGTCPGGARPLLKTVLAIQNDRVVLTSLGVFRSGVLLPSSIPLSRDSLGRPLPRLPLGLHQIPSGSLWLYAPHPHSFDSRIFGPVSRGLVRNTLKPFWTLP